MLQDLKTALRHLLKTPSFAVMAALMLAIGIGATTAIFSLVESVLLRPLPFFHSEQLVVLSDVLQHAQKGASDEYGVTAPDVLAYTRYTRSFDALGA